MRAPLFPLRTAAILAIAIIAVLAGALDAHNGSNDDQIWLLPYDSGRN